MKKVIIDKKQFFLLTIVIFLLSLPLLNKTIFTGHDTMFHLSRILIIKQNIEDGNLFFRIYTDAFNGYGYGAPLFYPQLFLYFPAILHYIGLPLTLSYNIFAIAVNIATVIISYYSYTKICKSINIGFICSILYTASTYRLLDMYTRASVGEYLAITFFPLLLYGIYNIIYEDRKWFILVIAISGILQSHILSFVIAVGICFVFCLFNIKSLLKKQTIIALVKAIIITILLNLWFLVPFLEANALPIYSGTDTIWNTEAYLFELFDIQLDGAHLGEMYKSGIGITKTVGIIIILGVFLYIYNIICNKNYKTNNNISKFSLILGIVSLIAVTNIFPWEFLKKIEFIKEFIEKFQFFWRFNIVSLLLLTLIAGYGFYNIMRQYIKNEHIVLIVTILVSINTLTYINNYTHYAGNIKEENIENNLNMDTLYLIEGNTIFSREDLESNINSIEYINYVNTYNSEVSFSYKANEEDISENSYIEVPISYYPGYIAIIDGEKVSTGYDESGVVKIPITKNQGNVIVKYEEKTVYKICNIISIISIILFSIYIIYIFKKSHFNRLKKTSLTLY